MKSCLVLICKRYFSPATVNIQQRSCKAGKTRASNKLLIFSAMAETFHVSWGIWLQIQRSHRVSSFKSLFVWNAASLAKIIENLESTNSGYKYSSSNQQKISLDAILFRGDIKFFIVLSFLKIIISIHTKN